MMSASAHDFDIELNGNLSTVGKLKAFSSEETVPDKEAAVDVEAPNRQLWSKQLDFILSVVGFAVGLGNVWRFPYLCYKNGGGAFLVPYFIVLVCGGVPIFFLEIALGQLMSQGGFGAWMICPIFKGIGIATTVIVFLLNIYYIVVLAWDVYYFYMSFTTVLPWSHCNNTWNTARCRTNFKIDKIESWLDNTSSSANLSLIACANSSSTENITTYVDPTLEFWERQVLQISSGIDHPDGIVGHLAISLLVVWVICYFCIWKGIKWTGKVVYFTATFPYVILTVLLIRGVTLDGAVDGIVYYLKPDFTKLGDSQVWLDAGTQIFFSYAIALGAMTALGSYNRYHNNFYRDCIMISCINSCTSIYAGFAIFSVLGFMAKEQGVSVSAVAESGPGLVFIAYPKAVTQMPGAPFWALLFFFMVLLLGLDSQFVGIEAFVTIGTDMFAGFRKRKEIFIAIYCVVSYLIGLSMVTRGGMYVFQLFDYYSASGMALLWVCFFECVAVAWIYGVRRFYDNIEQMLGFRINQWLKICWTVITPLLTLGIFVFMWVQYKPLTYNRTYVYPPWAISIGLCMAFASMVCIPIYFICKLISTRGTLKQRWKTLTTPVLMPNRVPVHWPDCAELQMVGRHEAVAKRFLEYRQVSHAPENTILEKEDDE